MHKPDVPAPAFTPAKRRRGTMQLASFVPDLIAPVLQGRGFASAAILTEWREIVGPAIAASCTPLEIRWPLKSANRHDVAQSGRVPTAKATKTSKAVLIVACPGAFALDLQAASPTILEIINRRLGWACLGSLQIHQVARPLRSEPVVPAELSPEMIKMQEAVLGDINEPALRIALARFGAAVESRKQAGADK